MGHQYCFLTARGKQLYEPTVRVLGWNDISVNDGSVCVNATEQPIPEQGQLYCAYFGSTEVNEYKLGTVNNWLKNLHERGWKGKMVIIDDLLKPFRSLVESGSVMGISLEGDLNINSIPYDGEIRERSWEEIAKKLMEIHEEAVAQDPNPYRVFDCRPALDRLLIVNKGQSGPGKFTLDGVSKHRFVSIADWSEHKEEVLESIGITP